VGGRFRSRRVFIWYAVAALIVIVMNPTGFLAFMGFSSIFLVTPRRRGSAGMYRSGFAGVCLSEDMSMDQSPQTPRHPVPHRNLDPRSDCVRQRMPIHRNHSHLVLCCAEANPAGRAGRLLELSTPISLLQARQQFLLSNFTEGSRRFDSRCCTAGCRL